MARCLPGDWKLGNLGAHPDGRTILLDWTLPGAGPACWELCWYLALNRARPPEPKEAVIDRFRAALEHHGIDRPVVVFLAAQVPQPGPSEGSRRPG
jgi:hypothetical protein